MCDWEWLRLWRTIHDFHEIIREGGVPIHRPDRHNNHVIVSSYPQCSVNARVLVVSDGTVPYKTYLARPRPILTPHWGPETKRRGAKTNQFQVPESHYFWIRSHNRIAHLSWQKKCSARADDKRFMVSPNYLSGREPMLSLERVLRISPADLWTNWLTVVPHAPAPAPDVASLQTFS